MSLRVLFVTGEYPPMTGGIADYTSLLVQELSNHDVQPLVLSERGTNADEIVDSWTWRTIHEVRSMINRLDIFDPAFWMYCEEIEWCWRIRHHGWKIFYIPDVEIVHYEGASTAQDVPLRQLAFDRSRIELQRGLYGHATSLVVESGIRLGYSIQLGIECMKWMLGHRRDLRRHRMSLYLSLLSSSMRTRDRNHQR